MSGAKLGDSGAHAFETAARVVPADLKRKVDLGRDLRATSGSAQGVYELLQRACPRLRGVAIGRAYDAVERACEALPGGDDD